MLVPCISNLAWKPEDRLQFYEKIADLSFGIEIAPGLLFPLADDPLSPPTQEIDRTLKEWKVYEIRPASMQSLMFGKDTAKLFGTDKENLVFINVFKNSISLAANLGIPNIVFGSPTNRFIPEHMKKDDALEIAKNTFLEIADFAHTKNVKIALEPNPIEYKCNFITDFVQAARFVDFVDHGSFGINLDLGERALNQRLDSFNADLQATSVDRIFHIHVSEPFLAPAPHDTKVLHRLLSSVQLFEYTGYVSIEMLKQSKVCVFEKMEDLKDILSQINERR